MAFVENKIGPISYKLSRNKVVNTISNGFMTILPIILIGSFAALFSGFTFEAYQAFIANTGIKSALNLIVQLTNNCISLYVTMAIAYQFIRKDYPTESTVVGFTALLVFLMITPLAKVENVSYLAFEWLGAKGLFMSIIVGLIVGYIYELCFKKGIYVKMPKGVPNVVSAVYRCLVPGLIITVLTAVTYLLSTNAGGVQKILYGIISAPFLAMSNSFLTKLIIDVMVQLLWFFGLHGGNVMGAIRNVLYQPATVENINNYAAGLPVSNILTMGFDAVVQGAAPLNMAIIVLCIRSKKEEFKAFGKVAAIPTLFAISEPIRFGLPIVLNSFFFIPILISSIMNTSIVYTLMKVGVLGYPVSQQYKSMIYFLGTIFNVGLIPGILITIVLFVLNYIIVAPFFKMYEKNGMVREE